MDAGWPAGYAKQHFETIDSTNEEARRRALAGEAGPIWLYADMQSAGRGRRGRTWVSPNGNLFATLLLRPDKPPAECAQLSFVTALALSDALASLAPRAAFKLKWPNDVLADGKKISGILLESASGSGGAAPWLAIGVGVNLATHPADTPYPATALGAYGAVATPDAALSQLASSFAKWYDIWARDGFAPIRDGWLARASGLGQRITARLSTEEASGVFEGIDDGGALILRQAGGKIRTIAAGDIFFGG
ncbi:MAG TPA: biotin--[acetyl-CoA-carboxylase] ligase [Rhizomicrobium sp.]|nr:biotin--[acetyl-CoA-carboxylase] ligase [Rhizomicrobium sp.]